MKKYLLLPLIALTLNACTWVALEESGANIRVAEGEDLSACTQKGTITTSVKHKVGFYERNDLKVREELETMARNDAAENGADTIQALGEPVDGEQKFGMYDCR